MKFERLTFYAGKTILIKEKAKRTIEPGRKRAPKMQFTSDQVWEYNLRQAIFNLALILNANFVPGDWNLMLTFKEGATMEEVKAARDRFVRKLRDLCKKEGIEFKWVLVPHITGGKYHFHMISNKEVPLRLIKKAWKAGEVIEKAHMWDNPNYYQLASYLMHEARELRDRKQTSEEEIPFTKRYSHSRNLYKPVGEPTELTRLDMEAEPTARKGYMIDGEVQHYENFINGAPCREYVQVSITDGKTRMKRRNKGTMATGERMPFYKLLKQAYREQQESMFDSLEL